MASESAGDVYAGIIDQLLQQERDRKVALEQKALGVITTSGVLVTLLFGFSTIAKAQNSPPVPVLARILLIAALVAFLLAAVLCLAINRPVDHSPLGVERDLRRMVTDELWNDVANNARWAIAEFRVDEIDRWRENNGRKARRLQNAVVAESCGVVLLAASVVVLLLAG